jgi:hypothetical protein
MLELDSASHLGPESDLEHSCPWTVAAAQMELHVGEVLFWGAEI